MSERSKFFKKLRDEHYTILCPDMLPIHFELISAYLRTRGYNIKVLEVKGRAAKDEGLKAIHNDACYPAIIVAGQFINELKTGKYDLNRTAVIMSQTGGGCRASNYISLFRNRSCPLDQFLWLRGCEIYSFGSPVYRQCGRGYPIR